MLTLYYVRTVVFTAAFTGIYTLSFSQTTIYSEDFNSGTGGWVAVDVNDATNVWTNTGAAMQINGFGGGDDLDWLISPAFDLDAQTDEYFFFDYIDDFSGNLLELYYSTNYNGGGSPADVNAATWVPITLQIRDINSISCHPNILQRHPAIDISNIIGTSVYFGFRYTGLSSTSKDYTIDNVHIEAEYYSGTGTLNCSVLKTELHRRIRNMERIRYTSSTLYDVWDAFHHTDVRLNDAGTQTIVWDMFTDIPTGTGEFEFDHCNDRDNGSCPGGEGQCYNREHTFPRSWWGGGTTLSDTINFDLHHLFPSDRNMNSTKSNYPPGEVITPSATGSNGFTVGSNSAYPCTSTLYYEPIDAYKGDYARAMFYIATRFQHQMTAWETINARGDCALSGDPFLAYEPWLIDVLLQWHTNDPVSQKEIDRNNAIHAIQGNRNPFIDVPNFVNLIWGDASGTPCNLVPLPVTLASFEARQIGEEVLLEWSTLSEYRNDYFLTQRSTDLNSWKTLDKIDGSMDSQELKMYQLVDANPQQGTNYYRLCQVDSDGTKTLSEIRSVQLKSQNGVFPNPCKAELFIKTKNPLRITDFTGKDVTKLIQLSYINEMTRIDVQQLSAGVYFLFVNEEAVPFVKTN